MEGEITVEELINLCKTKKLKSVVEKVYNEAKANGLDVYVFTDMTNMLFDIETKRDFVSNVVSYFEKGSYIKGEDDGWQDSELDKNFAKLLKNWNWDNIELTDGNIVVASREDGLGYVSFFIFNKKNLHDGSIEMRYIFPNHFYEIIR